MFVCYPAGLENQICYQERKAHVLPGQEEEEEKEKGWVRGGAGGVHPNQSTSSPPALSAEGPTDFCMQTHSRSQLEPSLPRSRQRLASCSTDTSSISTLSSIQRKSRGGQQKAKAITSLKQKLTYRARHSCYLLPCREQFSEVHMDNTPEYVYVACCDEKMNPAQLEAPFGKYYCMLTSPIPHLSIFISY